MTVEELLKKYPNGFHVSASGQVYELVSSSSHLPIIAKNWPLPPPNGGYIVVREVEEKVEVRKSK